jgi:hypothetical protein
MGNIVMKSQVSALIYPPKKSEVASQAVIQDYEGE